MKVLYLALETAHGIAINYSGKEQMKVVGIRGKIRVQSWDLRCLRYFHSKRQMQWGKCYRYAMRMLLNSLPALITRNRNVYQLSRAKQS